VLDPLDPLTLSVEPSVSLHGCYDAAGGYFHLAGPLDDYFERSTNVSLAL